MDIQIISSSSKGNCYVVTDSQQHQLLIECGVQSKDIIKTVHFSYLDVCIISHEHSDHNLSKNFIMEYGVPVYDTNNMRDGQKISVRNWIILPIMAYHNIPCFSFMIVNVCDKKKILFITDTAYINKNIADTQIDCALIEANYSLQYVIDNFDRVTNFGYKYHLSIESLCDWLKSRKNKPDNLVLIHLSNSGNIEPEKALFAAREHCKNVVIGKSNSIIQI